jgi:hypothetical protein
LGDGTNILNELASGKHAFSKTLSAAKRPLVILGSAMFERPDGTSIYANAAQLSEKLRDVASKEDKEWRVFNVLHRVWIFSFFEKYNFQLKLLVCFSSCRSGSWL